MDKATNVIDRSSDAAAARDAPAAEPGGEREVGSLGLTYNPGLDGIRGLAVLAVLLFHGGFSWGATAAISGSPPSSPCRAS